ncbi:MAG: hypothetical protein L0Z50_40815 [Verrucomicrobiales bacterium]|nr:hypothetical protein [Verrucomicrobiales bacterium]
MNLENATDNSGGKAAELATQTTEAITRGTERFMQMKDRVWDKSKGLARGMDNCVHEHAWMALGITAAVGLILGLAFSRR